jgi:hypothetical protein
MRILSYTSRIHRLQLAKVVRREVIEYRFPAISEAI